MAHYYRPNFTAAERDVAICLVRAALAELTIDSPEFDTLYRMFSKLQSARYLCTYKRADD